MERSLPAPFSRLRIGDAGLMAVGGLGLLLRLRRYLFARSLWLDEAALAVNILERDPLALTGPLEFGQVAPYGFMLLTKGIAAVLGPSELALRLVPFLAGVGSMILLAVLLRRLVSPLASLLGLAVLAVSPPQIKYAAELKPYATDVAVALVLLLLLLQRERRENGGTTRRTWLLIGVGAVWLSYPSVFVLASVGVADTVRTLTERHWERLRRWLPVYAGWALSFALSLPQVAAGRARLDQLSHWQSGFMPVPPRTMAHLEWFLDRYLAAFEDLLGVPVWSGIALLTLVGLVLLWRGQPILGATVVGTIAFLLAASGMEVYPAQDRAILFLSGPLLLGAAVACDRLFQQGSEVWRWLTAAFIAVMLLWQPLLRSYREFRVPPRQEEVRDVMNELKARHRPGDTIYVYYGAEPATRFYAARLELEGLPYDYGTRARSRPSTYLQEIEDHLGEQRAWFVFAHDHFGDVGNERQYILEALNCVGQQQLEVRRPGAHLYLYDLSLLGESNTEQRWAACQP